MVAPLDFVLHNMANRQNQHIDSPAFKELCFRVLSKLTPDQKENLSVSEAQNFKNEYTLQKFCKENRMDYLMYILAKCGIDWTFRIHEKDVDADMVEFNTAEQYKYPLKRLDNIEATSRSNVCIISSRDVMVLSHMVAQNCLTKIYHISEFSKKLKEKGRNLQQLTSWDDQIVKASAAHDLFNRLMVENLKAVDYAEGVLGLDAIDLRILGELYDKRNTALRLRDIADSTFSQNKRVYLKKNMNKLLEEGLVYTDEKDKRRIWLQSTYFVITTAGLNKIINYRKYVYKNIFR